ncbi:hypothetical protein BU14_0205s0001 [Porphyra umbilicalis]|uniref:Uncharacterized protein n=1 Tax=Porphyra umbilicalis TaxID=2786 RepID=A0A1X6P5U7_PORUM|nr:hypothetical protein BU14_0205s0001 [Porphyra umbilicalis]|eukprot:OSX76126.1 hypothetical protein BU14_0205s0001 [Porphyra umbilicalis]
MGRVPDAAAAAIDHPPPYPSPGCWRSPPALAASNSRGRSKSGTSPSRCCSSACPPPPSRTRGSPAPWPALSCSRSSAPRRTGARRPTAAAARLSLRARPWRWRASSPFPTRAPSASLQATRPRRGRTATPRLGHWRRVVLGVGLCHQRGNGAPPRAAHGRGAAVAAGRGQRCVCVYVGARQLWGEHAGEFAPRLVRAGRVGAHRRAGAVRVGGGGAGRDHWAVRWVHDRGAADWGAGRRPVGGRRGARHGWRQCQRRGRRWRRRRPRWLRAAAVGARCGRRGGGVVWGGPSPHCPRPPPPPPRGTWATLIAAAWSAPFPFWRLFVVQCLTWTAWFALFIYATSWLGGDVLGGVADAPPGTAPRATYDRGVRWGNGGLAAQAVVSVVYATALPALLRSAGAPAVYAGGHVVLGGALVGMLVLGAGAAARAAAAAAVPADAAAGDAFTARAAAAVALLAITGVPWATTMTVPWALMGAAVTHAAAADGAPASAGVYATLFNLSQCFPEVAVSLVSAQLVRGGASQGQVLGAAGAVALGGAALIYAWPLERRRAG